MYNNKFNDGDCPTGCSKGICLNGLNCNNFFPFNEKCCNFNFECNNCNDTNTNSRYKEFETQKYDNINDLIDKQNEYINNMNSKSS